MQIYRCEICEKLGENERGGCFREQEEILVPIPELEIQGQEWRPTGQTEEERLCDRDGMLEVLEELQLKFPGQSVGEIWLTLYSTLCPVSFIDEWCDFWFSLEAACCEYGKLPYDGGLLDQPKIVLDILETIRIAKVQYYLWRSKQKEK